jgi:5-methyltetrahydrofolate--homocysteine methyltransferase
MNSAANSVQFSDKQYDALRQTYRKWWDGTLERPIVPIITTGHASNRKSSENPLLTFATAWDTSIRPEQYMDAFDYQFSTQPWHGDAFPYINTHGFGPGVLAAFLGCTPFSTGRTVWFQPPREDIPIEELHFEFDDQNPYWRRVVNIYEAALEKWKGNVIMSTVDMGGTLDVLASFRGSENLLLDLYDEPEEVLRLNQEIQTAWYDAYNDFSQVLAPQKCYTDWNGILSSQPSYVLQCDFCYMISNPMFRQFVLETLREDTRRLTNTIYHLDGIGQLNHLDDLLSLENLRAVQWVPGMGKAPTHEWMDVYKKIQAAGKHSMIIGDPESYFAILNEVHGTPFCAHSVQTTQLDLAQKLINAR